MNQYVVYCHTNTNNGKMYVGWAICRHETPESGMTRRWKVHCKNATRGDDLLLSRAIIKHGQDVWKHEVLETAETREAAKSSEMMWISKLRTCAFDHPATGYNMTRGGDGGGALGHVQTSEHRQKISNARKGWKPGEETRSRMSEAKKGKPGNARGSKRSSEWILKHSGENAPSSKLTRQQRDEIVNRYAAGNVTQLQLSVEYGIGQSSISRLLSGKTWKVQPESKKG